MEEIETRAVFSEPQCKQVWAYEGGHTVQSVI